MSTFFAPNILNHSFCCAESALTLQWYTGHRTAQELTEETRAVSRPLRGVAPPAVGVADGAVAGPSRARQFTGSPQQAPPREDQLQRPEPGPEVGPEAVPVQTAPVQWARFKSHGKVVRSTALPMQYLRVRPVSVSYHQSKQT